MGARHDRQVGIDVEFDGLVGNNDAPQPFQFSAKWLHVALLGVLTVRDHGRPQEFGSLGAIAYSVMLGADAQ